MNARTFWKVALGVGCGLVLVALLVLATCTALVGKFAADVSRDLERKKLALAELERACDSGDGKRCLELGNYHNEYNPEPKPGIRAYERACALKQPEGCYRAGLFWKVDHMRMKADPRKAAKFLNRACNDAVHEACTTLAEIYRDGQSVIGRDLSRARKLYRQGCDGGSAVGCEALAFIEKANAHESSILYQRACDLGLATACVSLAEYYFVGYGVQTAADRGQRLLEVACGRNEPKACLALRGSRPVVAGSSVATKRAWHQLQASPSPIEILANVSRNKDILDRLIELRRAYAQVNTADSHPEMVQYINSMRTWTDDAIRYFEDAARRDQIAADLQWITVPYRLATERNEEGGTDPATLGGALRKGMSDPYEITSNPNAPKEVRDLVGRLQVLMATREPLALRLEMAHGVFMSGTK
jgi:TPR repeat protein